MTLHYVAELLGDSMTTVEKTYRHACPKHLGEAL